MGYQRINRISEEIKKIVSHMILNELKDPRISSLTTVIDVEVTKDLRYATVFVSVYGSQEEKEKTIEALKNASGFIRKEIGKNLKLRYIPELMFKIDVSTEKGIYISDLIKKINKKEHADDSTENK